MCTENGDVIFWRWRQNVGYVFKRLIKTKDVDYFYVW